MKLRLLMGVGALYLGACLSISAQINPDFQAVKKITLEIDSANFEEGGTPERPLFFAEGRTKVFFTKGNVLSTLDLQTEEIQNTPVDKDFKISILSKMYDQPDSMYALKLPGGSDVPGMEAAQGGTIVGLDALGDTLYFTYNFSFIKKVGANQIPQLNFFLVSYYNGKVIGVTDIDHGIVMSIDMPVYFMNPSIFHMESPNAAIFGVLSYMENRPNLFATYEIKKNRWEMKKVLDPLLAKELINEEKELTLLGASQSYIAPPFMGGNFSNEIWTYEKKSKVFQVPSINPVQMGITMRLGKAVPPGFAVLDVVAKDNSVAHALVFEEKKVYLTQFEVRKGTVIKRTEVLDDAVESLEKLPFITLLSQNRLLYFDETDQSFSLYSY